jgi:hypothetical protein
LGLKGSVGLEKKYLLEKKNPIGSGVIHGLKENLLQ